jgi:hypothetical protein
MTDKLADDRRDRMYYDCVPGGGVVIVRFGCQVLGAAGSDVTSWSVS